MNAFFKELKERSVYRIAASYAVAAWLILQFAAIIGPALSLPGWTLKAVFGVLMAGFSAALWVGWLQDHRTPAGEAPDLPRSRRRHFIFAIISVLPALLVLAVFSLSQAVAPAPVREVSRAAAPPIPEKSIAVLPFESFSAEQENAYFADGIQDEILTDLSKVADLKVISRTSVLAYHAGGPRNSREIGLALGVTHLLEGSVQRDSGKVRVTAQLIDARSDSHLWAEHYDRELRDIFVIQSEIAERIVGSLKATLSPGEAASLATQPTRDVEAFDLYLRASALIDNFADSADWRDSLLKAIGMLDAATARDPDFATAYALAARAHDNLYWFQLDHTPARLALAQAAVSQALRLQPELGEAHLAKALLFYHGSRDFAAASRELALAREVIPNNAQVFSVSSWIARRQGLWKDSVRDQERAVTLDPRNLASLTDLTVVYDLLRRYPDENRVANDAIRALPQSISYFRLVKAQLQIETGQLAAAHKILDQIPADYDPYGATTFTRVQIALYERNFPEATAALAASSLDSFFGETGYALPRAWLEGLIARAAGDKARANASFLAARSVVSASVQSRPDDASAWGLLGEIDAALGRNSDAMEKGARAVALRPSSADAVEGPEVETMLAMIQAWTGDRSRAISALATLSKTPSGPHYAELRLDPAWDVLKGDVLFEKTVAEMAPAPVRDSD
jgi:TolB-like protein/Tfp pilus assembly protein PilF